MAKKLSEHIWLVTAQTPTSNRVRLVMAGPVVRTPANIKSEIRKFRFSRKIFGRPLYSYLNFSPPINSIQTAVAS